MGLEKYMGGHASPLPDEIEKARVDGGEEAVMELEEKMKKATARLQEKQSEKALDSLQRTVDKQL